MGMNKMGPPCPNCGSHITIVTTTSRTVDQGFWRSRKCPTCDHVFHTAQPPEKAITKYAVTWLPRPKGTPRLVTIDWSCYEAG